MNVYKRHKEDVLHRLPRDSILGFSKQAVNTLIGEFKDAIVSASLENGGLNQYWVCN